MSAFVVLPLLLSWLSGFWLTSILLPRLGSGAGSLPLRLTIGGGLGIGLSASLHFLTLLAGLSRYTLAVDLAVGLLLGLIAWRGAKRRCLQSPAATGPRLAAPGDAPPARFSKAEALIASLFAVELLASLGSFAVAFLKEPHGKWDAWLIWNMHARFLYRSGESWRDAFASGMEWSHWDYPLLLPLSIVRGWTYSGSEDVLVPAAFALGFTLLTVSLLLSALLALRSRIQGFLAAMVLLGTPFFIVMGASQFADVPLAFFMLATLALLFLPARLPEAETGALLLAGIAAGLCAWTKNEGLLYVTVVTAALFGTTLFADGWKPALGRTARFLAGALPVMLIVLYFKLQLSPANDLLEGFHPAAAAAKLLDPERYLRIAEAFFITGLSFTQGLVDARVGMRINPGAVSILLLIAYLLLAGLRIDDRDRGGLIRTAAVLVLMPAGYFFVYVMTPLDLGYHLATSLNRLFLQLWPSVIFLFFMIAGAPQSPSPAAGPSHSGSARPETQNARRTRPKARGPK